MATQSKAGKQSKSADAGREAPAPAETTLAGAPAGEEAAIAPPAAIDAESAVEVQAAAPAPAAEVVDIVATPLAAIEEAVESATESFSASFEFDVALWSKKSFELWAETAAAFMDLAERIAKADTFEEVVDLQSRFANERFEAFVRQSQGLMDFAKNMATLSTAPLCDVRKAA